MKNFYFYFGFLIALLSIVTVSSCAKKGTITGGNKDTLAPKIVRSMPANYTTNFTGNSIKIYFDELIKVKDINKQLIISPPLKENPIIIPQGSASKFISITFLDTLQSNTTYSLNFGQSITDNNEGNPYSQFKYVFSTGNVIDSLFLLGTIKDAYLQKTPNFVNIQLYDAATFTDSTIFKERPLYVTNTLDSVTKFALENLKEGSYKVIALKDKNNNYLYNPSQDKIGFLEKTIRVPNDTVFGLELFSELPSFSISKPSQQSNNKFYIPFKGDAKKTKVVVKSGETIIDTKLTSYTQKDQDTLQLFFPKELADSVSMEISNGDYVKNYTLKIKKLKEIDTLNVQSVQKGNLTFRDTLALKITTPLNSYDIAKIKLTNRDSAIIPFELIYNEFQQKVLFNFDVKEEQNYLLQLLPGAFTDFYDKKNDSLEFKYTTKPKTDYGNLKLVLQNANRYPIIVELLSADGKVLAKMNALDSEPVLFEALEPKIYTIRVIYDDNKNGVWDTGNFIKKRQPEEVLYFSKGIDIRANWDWEQIFDLSQ